MKNQPRNISFKWFYNPYRFLILGTVFIAAISAISDIGSWIIQKHILDSIGKEWETFLQMGILVICLFWIYTVNQIFWALTYYLSHKIWWLVRGSCFMAGIEKLSTVRFSKLIEHKEGELHEIISAGSNAIWEIIDKALGHIMQNILMITFGLAVICTIDVYLFLFLIGIFIPLFAVYSLWEIRKLIPHSRELNSKRNVFSWDTLEYLSNIRDLKVFWVQKLFLSDFRKSLEKIFTFEMAIESKHHFVNFRQFIILFLSLCLVLMYTLYRITLWDFTIGVFVLVFYIFNTIRFALWDSVFLYRNFQDNYIKAEKFFSIFTLPDSRVLSEQKQTTHFWEISLKNISFRYSGKKDVIYAIDLKIQAGEKIALLGRSGQGKTTLLSIILGLIDWYTGDILINGKPSHPQALEYSYVAQSVQLLNASLRDNLSLGEVFDDAEMIRMLQAVGLSDIRDRSWETSLLDVIVGSNGLKLSWGEKQRLGIARALLRKKDIYIFDEVTANLDDETEEEILNQIISSTQGKTCIFVTHKKWILRKVDRVYELKRWTLQRVDESQLTSLF